MQNLSRPFQGQDADFLNFPIYHMERVLPLRGPSLPKGKMNLNSCSEDEDVTRKTKRYLPSTFIFLEYEAFG